MESSFGGGLEGLEGLADSSRLSTSSKGTNSASCSDGLGFGSVAIAITPGMNVHSFVGGSFSASVVTEVFPHDS